MLPGVSFSATTAGKVYPLITDADGVFTLQFGEPLSVTIQELARASGGQWVLTTPLAPRYELQGCETLDVWVGNAPVKPPRTGRGKTGPGSRPGSGGPYRSM